MHTCKHISHRFITLLLLFLFMINPAYAQLYDADDPAPQFLYRDDDQLIMVNGYTGETSTLDIDITDQDFFSWTPDGTYLFSAHHQGNNNVSCINFYDVDTETWLYDEPVSCDVDVREIEYAADGATLAYSTVDDSGGSLWLHDLENGTDKELYRAEGEGLNDAGISTIQWSPTGAYLTFIHHNWIMGGTLNNFVVLKMDSGDHFWVTGANPYYASYAPIWSEDDNWFLITLKAQYVESGGAPFTNHEGDVYLVHNETGDQYRLTYTPAVFEYDVHWTDDGDIAFTIATEHEFTFSLQDAMNIDVVPYEDIVQPEDFDVEAYFDAGRSDNDLISPDRDFSAWITNRMDESDEHIYELNIGVDKRAYIDIEGDNGIVYSVLLPEDYQRRNILIGWRPSHYPYSYG
ncbi:hypothetical protein G4Y79_07630 [Phototrophicus methaneseepsis]|uniref:WD40 repeat domain-containing protein n=1 Tax=Phototrophicus methaneseepsis TaxID=2710758 RepID=A0A7S8ECI5_9CHLR|nr:hypothetical protein [Phototrophicus methaneseepsis]QPC84233.1 hypothetical protein G4Y79_07630 [Phototrophicus methaneseepsis]